LYIKSGFSLIPIRYKDKRPSGKLLSQVSGFKTWKTYTERQPNEAELNHWFNNRKSNLGIVTGFNDLAVLDFDTMSQYCKWLKWMFRNKREDLAEIFVRSLFVSTSRGRHVYIRLKENAPRKFGDLDLKGQWGYVLAPPSIHPSGSDYRFFQYRPDEIDLPVFDKVEDILPPEWVEAEFERPEIIKTNNSGMSLWDRANTIRKSVGDIDYEDLKMAIPIESLMPNGNTFSQSGKFILTLCPFHDDQTPSFWINTESNTCGCYANCFSRSQTIFGFYSKLKRISINEAIIQLSEMVNNG
jgi:hypothetical protein